MTTTPLGRRGALGVALLVALRTSLDVTRLATTPWKYWNWEETHNAAVAWYALHAGLWDQILPLQYKSFCGGCTVLAAAALPALGLGGDHFLLWKGIALAWTAATLVATFVAVDRTVGRAGAWGALVLLAVPPLGLADVDLMLWGNHAESALLVAVAVALAARDRSVGLGLWVGLALWFTRTTVYGAVVVLAWQTWRHRARLGHVARLWIGLAVGFLPALVPAGRGDSGYYDMSPLANLFPQGSGLALQRVVTLISPAEMAPRLFRTLDHMEPAATAWLVGGALAAVLALRTRTWVWAALALSFGFFFVAASFAIARTGAQGGVINLRYHAPWMYTVQVLAGVVAGSGLGGAGRARRGIAGLVGLLVLGATGVGWARSVGNAAWTPGMWEIAAVSSPRFAWIAVWRFQDERLARAHSPDPVTESWLRRMEGYRAAGQVNQQALSWEAGFAGLHGQPDAVEAFGQALTDPDLGWQNIPAINASLRQRGDRAQSLGRGIGWNLGFGVVANRERRGAPSIAAARQTVGAIVDKLRAGLSAEEPCLACVAAGATAITACRGMDPAAVGACLNGAVAGLPDADEVLYGAAVWCRKPGHPPAECAAVDAGPAFRAGLADPMAGVDRAFKLIEPGGQAPNPLGG